MLVGDNRPFIGALLALDPDALDLWQQRRGRTVEPGEGGYAARADPDLLAELKRAVATANTAVSRGESIRSFRILPGEITESRGLLTPSLKLRRRAVVKAFATEIDALYSEAASAYTTSSSKP